MFKVRYFFRAVCVSLILAAGIPANAQSDKVQGDKYQSDADLAHQQEKQRQIQAETDFIVRRLGTMLRVLEYYQVDQSTEKKLLQEMTSVLGGLSKQQMAEVIRRLGAAAKALDEDKSKDEIARAYDKHREVVDSLKALLVRHDAVRSLDQAADRLEKHAKSQLELHLQASQLFKDITDKSNPNLSPTQRLLVGRRLKNQFLDTKRQGDDQQELAKDVDLLLQQVLDLRDKLPEEQRLRVKAMEKLAGDQRLMANLSKAAQDLKASAAATTRFDSWRQATDLQFQSAGTLQEMARVLRLSAEMLQALKQARERLDQTIAKQGDVNRQTEEADKQVRENEKNAEKPSTDRKAALEKAIREAQAAEKNAELSKQQARLEHDTRGTENILKPHVKDLADKLVKAERAMQDAKDALNKNAPKNAAEPQDKAKQTLEDVRKEVDKMIAQAEKAKNDPLAALKKAAEDVDKLLKDQTQTRDQTKDTAEKKDPAKLPELTKDQKNLAERTEGLKDTPLPGKEKVAEALDKANKAMNEAAKNLDAKKPVAAMDKQDNAIEALKEAKKELAEKTAEIEKRKDDMAKLEDAKKKLDDLAKAENKVAGDAKDVAEKPGKQDTKELAKNQEKLTPKTEELAKDLQKTAPDASQKVADSAKNMEAAKKELDMNKAEPGAKEATEAAKKLEDAQKSLAKAMDDLKGKDIADQAALQPKKVDPQAAAQQLAKALEEAQKAAEQSKQAEKLARKEMKKDELEELDRERKQKPNLAKLQADVAKQAADMKLPDAAKAAAKAADALKQGDVPEALKNQENALAKLNDAAKDPTANQAALPKEGEPKSSPMGEAKNTDAKQNQPNPAEAKNNPNEPMQAAKPMGDQPKAGEAKQGEPKAGDAPAQAKANEATPGEAKNNVGKAEPKTGQPKNAAVAKAGEPKAGKPKAKGGDQKPAQAQAKADGKGPEMGAAKDALAKAGEGKSGPPMSGEAKDAMPSLAQGKGGDPKTGAAKDAMAKAGEMNGDSEAQAKGSDQTQALPKAENAGQLAKAQKELMDATKNIGQSQEATQAAMAALGQAKAQAPRAVQQQLQQAGKDLAQAAKELDQARPGQAGKNQMLAAANLQQALEAMNAGLKEMNKPGAQPGQLAQAQPGNDDKDGKGQDAKEGEGKEGQGEPKEGQPSAQAQAKGEKSGKSLEKNEPKGSGNRVADGKVGKGTSQVGGVEGDGTFLHLPPRQRELIRQALSAGLPPEYAAMIQQYYMNLARGKNAAGPR
ncbi:MAG: DUF4175 family protein [Planctomycetes bacterium]|nr:DUF4175 family protein [Planctomycetota bacterium]